MNQDNALVALKNRQRVFQRQRRIKIDLNKTQYPLIRNVTLNDLGWTLWGRKNQKGDANLFWCDTYVSQQFIKRLNPYQRVNHFPSSQQLGKKNLLTENIKRLKSLFPKQYNFYPQTWVLPEQSNAFSTYQQQHSQAQDKNKWYIVKPSASSQGKGIYLTKQVQINCKEPKIVQQYITNPLLIENCKFDLRIYVFIKSLFPLKIFRYQEGLARLSTVDYISPNKSNKQNLNMHLTNYSINKWNPSFLQNKSIQDAHIGHKRSLQAIFKYLSTIGCDNQKLSNQINEIIVKTILAAYPKLSQSYKECRETEVQISSVCFQILGFDVIIDQNFKPWLLQVNHSPSFWTQSPLDLVVKQNLILDTLLLLNLNGQEKELYFKYKSKQRQTNIKDKDMMRIKRTADQIYQQNNSGFYEKIYPSTKPSSYSLILRKLTERKLKHPLQTPKRKIQVKGDIDSSQTEGGNSHTSYNRKRNAMTLYGHFQQIKQAKQESSKYESSQDSQLRRHLVVERQRKKFIEPIKLHNIDIQFFQQNKTYYNRSMLKKRGTISDKPNLSPHNPSKSYAFEPKTADGDRNEIKRLDHEIKTRIQKMKLARIKMHKMKSKQSHQRKQKSSCNRIMTNPLKSEIRQIRGQNKYI